MSAELIGARLRTARGDRTVNEVARAAGVTVVTWYRWESGLVNVPPARYMALAGLLGVPWHELFAPGEVT